MSDTYHQFTQNFELTEKPDHLSVMRGLRTQFCPDMMNTGRCLLSEATRRAREYAHVGRAIPDARVQHDCFFYHTFMDRRRSPVTKSNGEAYRPALCKSYNTKTGVCNYGPNCVYAHGYNELLFHPAIYKTKMCKYASDGAHCPAGMFCCYAHGPQDLRTPSEVKIIRKANGSLPETEEIIRRTPRTQTSASSPSSQDSHSMMVDQAMAASMAAQAFAYAQQQHQQQQQQHQQHQQAAAHSAAPASGPTLSPYPYAPGQANPALFASMNPTLLQQQQQQQTLAFNMGFNMARNMAISTQRSSASGAFPPSGYPPMTQAPPSSPSSASSASSMESFLRPTDILVFNNRANEDIWSDLSCVSAPSSGAYPFCQQGFYPGPISTLSEDAHAVLPGDAKPPAPSPNTICAPIEEEAGAFPASGVSGGRPSPWHPVGEEPIDGAALRFRNAGPAFGNFH